MKPKTKPDESPNFANAEGSFEASKLRSFEEFLRVFRKEFT
jgi:hypothetical protein